MTNRSPAPAAPRDSSAVLLVRGDGEDLEVFLVERAPELRFFGGYFALPGGVRSADDLAAADGDDERSLRLCATRELFEETGILLRGGTPSAQRAELRAELLREDGDVAAATERTRRFVAATQALAAADTLTPVCRITTPPFAPVRYDTLFCLARLPDGETPDVRAGELVSGRFVQPRAILAAWRRGEVLLVPPVVILLQLLVHGDVARFLRDAARIAGEYRAGALHRVQFTPGIVMASVATPTLPPATTTNCMIVGEDRLQVVDPGTHDRDEQARLLQLLDELCAEGRTVDGVLLTHHHIDHIGAADVVAKHFGVAVRAHPTTLQRLAGRFRAGAPLHDGDRIALGQAPDGTPDWHLVATFTPGHDRGHLCFRESRYDAVCVGDMLSTVSSIVIDPPEGHMRTYLASLERLLAEPMGTLYPAHGPAARDGHTKIRQYLRHRSTREANLVRIVRETPGTLTELLPKVYWDVDARMHAIAIRSLLAGLEKLAEEGHVVERDGTWSARADAGDTP